MANPTQQDEMCLVCGDRASGFHYGQLSCEGCKGFFRRCVTKPSKQQQCKYGDNCEIDMYMRRKCPACRFKKCKAIGMRQECVVPEVQCAIKRESKRAQKDKDKPNSTTREHQFHHDTVTQGQQPISQDQIQSNYNNNHQQPINNGTNHQPQANNNSTNHQPPTNNNYHHQLQHHVVTHGHQQQQQIAQHQPPIQQIQPLQSVQPIQPIQPLQPSLPLQPIQTSLPVPTLPPSQPTPPSQAPHQTPSRGHQMPINHLALQQSTNNQYQTNYLSSFQNHNAVYPMSHNSLSPSHAATRLHILNNNLLQNQNQWHKTRAREILKDRQGIIDDLLHYQNVFESPKEEDIRNLPPYNEGPGESQLRHFTEMTILTVKLIVEFAKKVYGFESLTREDQITLLKASASEIMMLRSTRKYDIKTDSILFANNQPFTRENYRKAHIGEIADAMFNFCRSTIILRLDSAEYALITALIIFSERPNLREPEKVQSIQEFYLELVQAYVELSEQSENCKFARLLSLLPELRALGIVNSDVCFSLKVKNHRLPEFLAEIWDINQEKQDNDD